MHTRPDGFYVTKETSLPDGTKVVRGHWASDHRFAVIHEVDTDNLVMPEQYRADMEKLRQRVRAEIAAAIHHLQYGAVVSVGVVPQQVHGGYSIFDHMHIDPPRKITRS